GAYVPPLRLRRAHGAHVVAAHFARRDRVSTMDPATGTTIVRPLLGAELSADSSFARRFYAWVGERFPLANGLLFFVVYAAALLLGRQGAGATAALHVSDLGGFAAAWAFFLMLRVFDEHKDYALDCRLHPERVLSRGLI